MTTEIIDKEKFDHRLDWWYYEIGANIIPVNTSTGVPLVEWKEGPSNLQKERADKELFESWKKSGKFNKGAAVIPGPVYKDGIVDKDKPRYLCVIDVENQQGIDDLCTREHNGNTEKVTLGTFAKKFIVEQHSGNPSSAHMFFSTTKSIPNKSLTVDGKLIMEIFGEPKHLTNISPSIHKDGTAWSALNGTPIPSLSDEMVDHIELIFRKYGQSYLSNNGTSTGTGVYRGKDKIKEGNRHNEMVKLVNSTISINEIEDKETLRAFAYALNNTRCEVPLPEQEINSIFESCFDYISRNRSAPYPVDVASFVDVNNKHNQQFQIPLWQLTPSIVEELEQHNFSISNYEPMNFIIAHRGLNQIVSAYVGKRNETVKDENGKPVWIDEGIAEQKEVPALRLKKPIINAIPVSVKKFDDGIHLEYQYSIRFNSNNKAFTVQTDTIEGITQELKGKGMILGREPEEALTHILNSMESTGNVTVSKNVQKRGFWMIDGKLDSYDVEIKRPTNEQIKECAKLLEDLHDKFKIKKVFSTTIKWGIVSPFSFVMKSHSNWLNWIHSHGFTNCGKTFGGILVLSMWRLGEEHNISFESISSVARFGERLKETTFPLIINEAAALSDDRHKEIVDMIKNAVELRIARSKFKGKNRYENIEALRSCIITANPAPPNDAAYKRKLVVVTYSPSDTYNEESIKEFNKWFMPKKHALGILGDFAADYIMNKPEILKRPWNDIGEEVLTELFKSVGIESPEWIKDTVERIEIADSIDDAYLNIRSYLTNTITESYSRYSGEHGETRATSLKDKLVACCKQNLIPFIEKHEDCYIITQSIMHKLRLDKYDGYAGGSLKGFAEILGLEYGPKRVGGKPMKVAYCSFTKMEEILAIFSPTDPFYA